jgi:four helix bundle protein
MGVSRFEDLRVWQEARVLVDEIGGLITQDQMQRDRVLRDQLNAATLSTMANIAEGFLRGRRKEFVHFLRIAAGSNGEARSLLHAATSRKYLTAEESTRMIGRTNSIGRMLRRLMESLERGSTTAAK